MVEGQWLSKDDIDLMYTSLYNALEEYGVFDKALCANMPLNICLYEPEEDEMPGSVYYYCGFVEVKHEEQEELFLLENSVDEAIEIITAYVDEEIKNKISKQNFSFS